MIHLIVQRFNSYRIFVLPRSPLSFSLCSNFYLWWVPMAGRLNHGIHNVSCHDSNLKIIMLAFWDVSLAGRLGRFGSLRRTKAHIRRFFIVSSSWWDARISSCLFIDLMYSSSHFWLLIHIIILYDIQLRLVCYLAQVYINYILLSLNIEVCLSIASSF